MAVRASRMPHIPHSRKISRVWTIFEAVALAETLFLTDYENNNHTSRRAVCIHMYIIVNLFYYAITYSQATIHPASDWAHKLCLSQSAVGESCIRSRRAQPLPRLAGLRTPLRSPTFCDLG